MPFPNFVPGTRNGKAIKRVKLKSKTNLTARNRVKQSERNKQTTPDQRNAENKKQPQFRGKRKDIIQIQYLHQK